MLAIVALEVPLGINAVNRIEQEVRNQAMSQAEVVAASANDSMAPPDLAQLDELAATNAKTVKGRVVIVDSSGRVLSDSSAPGRTGADYSTRPEIASAIRGRPVQTQRYSRSLKKDILATAVPVIHLGTTVGAVRITQSTDEIAASVERAVLMLAGVGLIVLLLGLGAVWFIARGMTRPLQQLEETAERVTAEDLSVRAEVAGWPEQRALATAFNGMLERLEAFIEEQNQFLRDASHQLKTPVGAIRQRLEEIVLISDDDAVRDEARKADELAVRMKTVTDNMLHLAHLMSDANPYVAWIDLEKYAQGIVSRWSRGTRSAQVEGIDVVYVPPLPGTRTHGACAQEHLDTIMDALVENAVEYCQGRGPVEVTVIDNGLEVLDRGPGLAPGEEETVFRRFRRGTAGQARPAGTGLGLAMAKEVAAGMGASVSLGNRGDGIAGARATVVLSSKRPTDGV